MVFWKKGRDVVISATKEILSRESNSIVHVFV